MDGERTEWRDECFSECQNSCIQRLSEQAFQMHMDAERTGKKERNTRTNERTTNERTNEWTTKQMNKGMPECLPPLLSWADLIGSLRVWRCLLKQAHVTWTHVPKFQMLELHTLPHSLLLLQPDKKVGQRKKMHIITIAIISKYNNYNNDNKDKNWLKSRLLCSNHDGSSQSCFPTPAKRNLQ